MELINWEDFEKVKLVVGTIVSAKDFPEARKKAYKLQVDCGSLVGVKQSSAQISELYEKEDLIGRKVICVLNFPPKQIGPFISEILVTGFVTDRGVVLASVDGEVANGTKLS